MSDSEGQAPSMIDGELREYRGRSGSPEGGPYIELRFSVLGDRIVETHWESNGCPAAQKAACGLAAFLKGRTIDQASRIDAEALGILIGGLPDGKGHYRTTFIYDARDRIAEIDPLGNRTTYSFDQLGRLQDVRTPLSIRTTTVYDAASQVVASVDGLGNRTSYVYDNAGNREVVIDALGRRTTSVYASDSNRVQATVNPLGHRVTNTFDVAGQLVTLTDENGGETWFVYDGAGRQKGIRNPLGFWTTNVYDAGGRLASVLDAKGNVKTISYNAVDQVTGYEFADGTRATFTYGDLRGLLTRFENESGLTTFATGGRPLYLGRTDTGGYVQTYSYNAVGLRSLMIDPDGGRFTYTYTGRKELSTLKNPDNNIYTAQYDADGRRTTLLMGLGSKRQYAYDAAGRLTPQIELNASNAPFITFIDSYDAVGNRSGRNQDGDISTWVYDDADRLIRQELAGAWATFVYDPMGNMLVKHHQGSDPLTMAYAWGQITTSVQGSTLTSYVYDATGNLELEEAGAALTTYVWNNDNRLTSIRHSDGTRSTYAYDPEGLRRTLHEPGGNLTTFVWDGDTYLQERS